MIESSGMIVRHFATKAQVAAVEHDLHEAEVEMARRAFHQPRVFLPSDPNPVETLTRQIEYWMMLPDEALS
jgi:uncharacterized Zn-finger protein